MLSHPTAAPVMCRLTQLSPQVCRQKPENGHSVVLSALKKGGRWQRDLRRPGKQVWRGLIRDYESLGARSVEERTLTQREPTPWACGLCPRVCVGVRGGALLERPGQLPSTSPSQGPFCSPLRGDLRESLPLGKMLTSLSEMEAKTVDNQD